MTISSRARALLLLLDNVGVDLDRARRLARARAPVDRWAQLSKAPTQVSTKKGPTPIHRDYNDMLVNSEEGRCMYASMDPDARDEN